ADGWHPDGGGCRCATGEVGRGDGAGESALDDRGDVAQFRDRGGLDGLPASVRRGPVGGVGAEGDPPCVDARRVDVDRGGPVPAVVHVQGLGPDTVYSDTGGCSTGGERPVEPRDGGGAEPASQSPDVDAVV